MACHLRENRGTGEVPVEVVLSFDGGEDQDGGERTVLRPALCRALSASIEESWGGKRVSEEIPLVGGYVWEPAPATDLRNMFFDVVLMKIEFGLVQFDVKAGVAG